MGGGGQWRVVGCGGIGGYQLSGGEVGVVGMGLSPSIDNGRFRGVCAKGGQCVTV